MLCLLHLSQMFSLLEHPQAESADLFIDSTNILLEFRLHELILFTYGAHAAWKDQTPQIPNFSRTECFSLKAATSVRPLRFSAGRGGS